MIQNVLRVGATIRKWAVLAWVAAVALTVLVNYGISGLFSVALFGVFVFLVFPREGGRKDRNTEFEPWRFGTPSEHEKMHDPAYRDIYPQNICSDKK